jgi:hypothetical protein
MKPVEWKTYRTRFLIKAKQLTSALSFTDHLGRHHCGRKGDYLVESADGVLSIAPRQIFEDIYVLMPCIKTQTLEAETPTDDLVSVSGEIMNLGTFRMEPLNIERVPRPKLHNCPVPSRPTGQEDASRRRKSPQSLRASRTSSHLSVM